MTLICRRSSSLAPKALSISICIVLMVAGVLLLAGCKGNQQKEGDGGPPGKGGKKGGGGPAPVTIIKVAERDVPWDVQVVGNVEAYSAVTVKSQISGELTQAKFKEGDYVKAGDVLFTIDRRPLEAQLQQAEATLAKNIAQTKQAEANLAKDKAQQQYSKSQAARYLQLMKEGIVSKDQNDQIQASYDAISQAIEADKAVIESSKAEAAATRANIENLKVQLGYTIIRSTITGRTGTLNVKQGNLVTANVTELMTINQVQPIYVTFAVPEARLNDIKGYMASGPLSVSVGLQENDPKPETGLVTFIDNNVDSTTGTIKLKATLKNAGLRLWPGQFARVSLRMTTRKNAAVVPNQVVQTGQEGSYVYVVREDSTVEVRPVTTGVRAGQDLVIESGLKPGETVVLEGQLRLAPNMRVTTREPGQGGERGGGRKRGEKKQ